jgi:hypothetical protein
MTTARVEAEETDRPTGRLIVRADPTAEPNGSRASPSPKPECARLASWTALHPANEPKGTRGWWPAACCRSFARMDLASGFVATTMALFGASQA